LVDLSVIHAQTALDKAKKIFSVFEKGNQLYIEANMMRYEKGNREPTDTLSYVFHKNRDKCYFKFGDIELITEGGSTIAVDHENHLISITKSQRDMAINQFFDPKSISSLLLIKNVQVNELNIGNQAGLKLTAPDIPSQSLLVRYDPHNWQLQEINVTGPDPFPSDQNKKPEIVTIAILYKKISSLEIAFKHNTSEFILHKGGKYIPSRKCHGYEVLINS
jgi:hypothetical protein